ncbi:MAG: hypothetical protein KKD73_09830 [Proteobacteria bacterium]|nr:hypothetical protein [Pseudomonadota bacterium]MBU1638892.1 hypothetical protein [Pseudomonadota bacterium]
MPTMMRKKFLTTFALVSRAAARRKIYAHKARQQGRQEVSHLLRALSDSEAVQARRVFNALRGQIDISDQCLSSIFEKELEEIIGEYSERLQEAQQEGNKGMIQLFTQLRAAEQRLLAFYSKKTKDVTIKGDQRYFVCQFCGYVHIENAPESCPICGAPKTGFRETR